MAILQTKAPTNYQEALFALHGVVTALRITAKSLAQQNPDEHQKVRDLIVSEIKESWGEDGTTIENEVAGFGLALELVNFYFDHPEDHVE